MLAAGSVFGKFGRRFGLSSGTEEAIDHLWQFLAYVANSLVFLLLSLGGVAATLAGRAIVAYGLGSALGSLLWVPLAWRHVVLVGGLRGAQPVGVAIGATEEFGVSTLIRDLVLAVVIVTLVLQGLALEPVLTGSLRAGHQSNEDDQS